MFHELDSAQSSILIPVTIYVFIAKTLTAGERYKIAIAAAAAAAAAIHSQPERKLVS